MRDICKNVFDGKDVLTWCSDSDFEYSVEVGDHVNVKINEYPDDDTDGVVADILEDTLVVDNGKGFMVLLLFDEIVDIEKI